MLVTPPTMVNNRAPRACPGGLFALRTLYIAVACVLSAFDIEPALDEDGNPQPPKAEFNSRVIRYVFLGTSARAKAMLTNAMLHQGSQVFQMCNQALI